MTRKSLSTVKYRCRFMNDCPDMKRNVPETDPDTLEHLSKQYYELCTGAAQETCSIYQSMEKKEKRTSDRIQPYEIISEVRN